MVRAFTLIELMIVIAIIAIIASIAIPNLLESRITAQESSAAAALKSGLLPGEVQFQAGGYCDLDQNGIGTYAVDGIEGNGGSGVVGPYNAMAGQSTVGNNITLNLLAPSFAVSGTYTNSTNQTFWPTISGFLFKTPITQTAPAGTSDGTGERTWGALTLPNDNSQGRKFFIISQSGNIYMSLPSNSANSGPQYTGGVLSLVTDTGAFGATLTGSPTSSDYLPYRR